MLTTRPMGRSLLLLLLLLLLLSGQWTNGRYVFLPYVWLMNCLFRLFRSSVPPLAPNISICFSNHQIFFFLLLNAITVTAFTVTVITITAIAAISITVGNGYINGITLLKLGESTCDGRFLLKFRLCFTVTMVTSTCRITNLQKHNVSLVNFLTSGRQQKMLLLCSRGLS